MQQSTVSVLILSAAALLTAGALACAGESATEPAADMPPVESAGVAAAPAPPQTEKGPEGVVNYTRLDATVACAGATPPEAMAELKTRGFAAVINFRTAGEQSATVDAGRSAAEAAGG